jgi:anti-sigma regulatory factor (Ser/Thr protein kinase)
MRIVITSDPRLLHVLRGAVCVSAQGAGFGEADAENMARAIDEAAANVIRHTYRNRHDGRLALEIRRFPDRMEFFLEDSGPKVSPEALRPRPLEDVRPGGLGTHFIRSLMDEGAYDPDFSEGNRLRLVKYLPRKVTSRDESSSQKRG